jgi:hypothetical protein
MSSSPQAFSLAEALRKQRIDLHLHTVVSDGTVTAQQAVDLAAAHRLEAISITDHDAVDVYDALPPGRQRSGVWLLSGVELDTHTPGCDPEILGYGFDPTHPELRRALAETQRARRRRAQFLVERVNERLGDEALSVEKIFASATVAFLKPHITRPLVEKGVFASTQRAREFLRKEIETPRLEKPSPERAIELIHAAGGQAVLAHPGYYVKDTDLDALVTRLADVGLDGLEGEYPYRFSPSEFPSVEAERRMVARLRALAARHSLLVTTGSDSHTAEDWETRHA